MEGSMCRQVSYSDKPAAAASNGPQEPDAAETSLESSEESEAIEVPLE